MKILNIQNINTQNSESLINFCEDKIKKNDGAFLVPINPIKVIKAQKDKEFQNIIDGADWVFPDAWGIKWAASFLYRKEIPILPGHQVMMYLIELAHKNHYRIFLLGTLDKILSTAKKRLENKFPKIKIVGMNNGFYSNQMKQKVFTKIKDSNPDLIFVAMGERKQEATIKELQFFCPTAIYLGVGGSIDLVAGFQPKPPSWIISRNLEWLFRIYKQPFRIPRFIALPQFVFRVMFEKLKNLLQ